MKWVAGVAAALIVSLLVPAMAFFALLEPAAATDVSAVAARTGIAPIVVDAQQRAVLSTWSCPGVSQAVIAGVWQKESGNAGGRTITANGDVRPLIFGSELPGGAAMGPGQFIPSSWAIFGADGNGDGMADPHNVFDAAVATVRHLCSSGGGSLVGTRLRAALVSYYGADVDGYADSVLGLIAGFTTVEPIGAPGGLRPAAGATLAEPAASRWEAVVSAARQDGVTLMAASSWRSSEHQAQLRWSNGCPDLSSPSSTCAVPTAPVGSSMHERGLAIDVVNLPGAWNWLAANGCRFGLVNLGVTGCGFGGIEDWHWSVNGG